PRERSATTATVPGSPTRYCAASTAGKTGWHEQRGASRSTRRALARAPRVAAGRGVPRVCGLVRGSHVPQAHRWTGPCRPPPRQDAPARLHALGTAQDGTTGEPRDRGARVVPRRRAVAAARNRGGAQSHAAVGHVAGPRPDRGRALA